MVRYDTVWLVHRTEEEKYGTVRYGHLGSTATPYIQVDVFKTLFSVIRKESLTIRTRCRTKIKRDR